MRRWSSLKLLAVGFVSALSLWAPQVSSQEQQFFDWGQGLSWYQEQAAAGNVEAQYRLAVIFERGVGIDADLAESRRWYRAAAEQGHPTAQFRVAGMLQSGRGGPADLTAAARW